MKIDILKGNLSADLILSSVQRAQGFHYGNFSLDDLIGNQPNPEYQNPQTEAVEMYTIVKSIIR